MLIGMMPDITIQNQTLRQDINYKRATSLRRKKYLKPPVLSSKSLRTWHVDVTKFSRIGDLRKTTILNIRTHFYKMLYFDRISPFSNLNSSCEVHLPCLTLSGIFKYVSICVTNLVSKSVAPPILSYGAHIYGQLSDCGIYRNTDPLIDQFFKEFCQSIDRILLITF